MLSIITTFQRICACVFVTGLFCLATAQTVTTVHSFDGTDGLAPDLVTLTQGRGGRLYGTTIAGGTNGMGTIFKQDTAGNGNATLYNFSGPDGNGPLAGLVLAGDGNYYGITNGGGTFNKGTLSKITSAGSLSVMHHFTGGSDGAYPSGPPIQAVDSNLYGITGPDGLGLHATVYKSTTAGAFSTIYTFSGTNDTPYFVAQGADGFLYLTLGSGGTSGCGSVVKITVAGLLRFRYDFKCNAKLGSFPNAPLMQASDGNFYGTNSAAGGPNNVGTIYRMSPTGTFTRLYSFGAIAGDGSSPAAGLTQATDGNLYGSTPTGGSAGEGSLYKLTLAGVYSQIYSFPKGGSPAQEPTGSLTQSTGGFLYGTTKAGGAHDLGSIFSLDVGLAPFVALQRYQGKPGIGLGVFGQGFTGTTAVTFNGVPATSFTVLEDTYMTAVVPSGAGTGPVLVTTPTGILKSNKNFAQK